MQRIGAIVIVIGLASGIIGAFAYDQLGSNAGAAPPPPSPTQVREQNLDGGGFIRVHEQGTSNVAGTVNVGNLPAVQDVRLIPAGPVEYTQVVAAWCDGTGGFCQHVGNNNSSSGTVDVIASLNGLAADGWQVVNVATSGRGIVWTLERPTP